MSHHEIWTTTDEKKFISTIGAHSNCAGTKLQLLRGYKKALDRRSIFNNLDKLKISHHLDREILMETKRVRSK